MNAVATDTRGWAHNRKIATLMARRGIAVFPCHELSNGEHKAKSPRNPGGHLRASRDERQICQWWTRWPDALVGMNLADAGLFAVDLDRHGGPDGVAEWVEWRRSLASTLPNIRAC